MEPKPKIIVIVGQSASGKTELGLKLAKEFNGEVVSADSRQVYKELSVGSGLPLGYHGQGPGKEAYFVDGVPHYLMDIYDPAKIFTAADFKREALAKVKNITKRGQVPIIVGGTGLYIWALVDNLDFPAVVPNNSLRQRFSRMDLLELVRELENTDKTLALKIDLKNRRRVERALEIALGKAGAGKPAAAQSGSPVEALQLGIKLEPGLLQARIAARAEAQFKSGFIEETQKLLAKGYNFSMPSLSGIGYQEIANYMQGELTLEETKTKIITAVTQYARRQTQWFKRDTRITWLSGRDFALAKNLVKDFLGV